MGEPFVSNIGTRPAMSLNAHDVLAGNQDVGKEGFVEFDKNYKNYAVYDEKGNIIKEYTKFRDNKILECYLYEYNEKGHLVKEIRDDYDDGEYERVITYSLKYDENGNLIKHKPTIKSRLNDLKSMITAPFTKHNVPDYSQAAVNFH